MRSVLLALKPRLIISGQDQYQRECENLCCHGSLLLVSFLFLFFGCVLLLDNCQKKQNVGREHIHFNLFACRVDDVVVRPLLVGEQLIKGDLIGLQKHIAE